MTSDSSNLFRRDHLERWWATTLNYLLADLESQPGAASLAEQRWPLLETGDPGGRKRFLERVRGWLWRSTLCGGGEDDPLRALESAFQQQITFIARNPEVPARLLLWLAQEGDRRLQRRVRQIIGYYTARLAGIIARAEQQGLVGEGVDPHAAAISLVGVIQELARRSDAGWQRRESFLREAAAAFALYRTGLTSSAT